MLGYIEDAIGQYVSRRTIEGRRAEEVLDDLIGFILSRRVAPCRELPEQNALHDPTFIDVYTRMTRTSIRILEGGEMGDTDEKVKRRPQLNIRLTESELEKLKCMAREESMTVTDLILRSTVYSTAERVGGLSAPKIAPELHELLSGLGELRAEAAKLAADSKSAASRRSAKRIGALVDTVEPRAREVLEGVSSAIAASSLRRR